MNGRKNRFGGLGSPRGLLVRSMTLEQLESRRCFDAAMQQIGDDHLGFAAVEQDFHFVPEKATAVLDGGNGFDTAIAPPGAKLMNVEA